MACVYIVRNNINNKVYIGKTIKTLNKRWTAHKTDRKLYLQNPLYQDMNQHGFENFYAEILIEGSFTDEQLSNLEKNYILRYNSITPNGYNQSTGGDSAFTWSEECIQKRKSKKVTWGDKISKTMELKWQDPEYRERMSNAHKGKRSKKRKPYVTSLSRLELPKEQIIAEYKSGMKIAQIAKKHGVYHVGIKLRLQRWLPEENI